MNGFKTKNLQGHWNFVFECIRYAAWISLSALVTRAGHPEVFCLVGFRFYLYFGLEFKTASLLTVRCNPVRTAMLPTWIIFHLNVIGACAISVLNEFLKNLNLKWLIGWATIDEWVTSRFSWIDNESSVTHPPFNDLLFVQMRENCEK